MSLSPLTTGHILDLIITHGLNAHISSVVDVGIF